MATTAFVSGEEEVLEEVVSCVLKGHNDEYVPCPAIGQNSLYSVIRRQIGPFTIQFGSCLRDFVKRMDSF